MAGRMTGAVDPGDLIAELGLAPHPEGGWYRETWRAVGRTGERAAGTAILFLLEEGQASHWHRVDAAEIWFWHGGAPFGLLVEGEDGSIDAIRLGPDILDGEQVQGLVPAGRWQAARAEQGWTLASCVVVPGFQFSGFELASPGWSPDAGA